jgi:uroporphyrinogen III methyltransferase / synthase
MKGKVYLVGAGPGDPGLITQKGRACIEAAEVIVYDYLAAEALLSYARENAEIIYAGKKAGDHTLSQSRINDLLVEKAKQGFTVTRLKGGDPFLFGRGGEEIEALSAVGIDFEVVPGVTSASAAPAYAGIPLTHRKFASCVTLVTGHEDPAKETSSINWKALAQTGGTLVFLMGVKNLPAITDRLLRNGMPANTPAAIIHRGTTPSQKTIAGTLETISEKAATAGLTPPCVIVVGEVVSLRKRMKWFEDRPLFGKKVLVTRARSQASDMVERLTALGAECVEFPAIRVVKAVDDSALDAAIDQISAYNWLIFTSVNGVDFFFKRLYEKGKDSRALGGIKTAAIGPATEMRLLSFGVKSDIVPDSYKAEDLIEAFKPQPMAGKRVLLPRASGARPVLPEALTQMGACVNEIPVYNTVSEDGQSEQMLDLLQSRKIDVITFTSSSTVTNLKTLIPADRFEDLVKNVTIAAIGPITAATARENGFPVHIIAQEYTIAGLCAAIVNHFFGDTRKMA